jgi:hypothetical protein
LQQAIDLSTAAQPSVVSKPTKEGPALLTPAALLGMVKKPKAPTTQAGGVSPPLTPLTVTAAQHGGQSSSGGRPRCVIDSHQQRNAQQWLVAAGADNIDTAIIKQIPDQSTTVQGTQQELGETHIASTGGMLKLDLDEVRLGFELDEAEQQAWLGLH